MLARYNRLSFAFGVPGLGMQFYGFAVAHNPAHRDDAALFQLGGLVFLIVGLAFYAKAKGRSGLWGLLGLFSLLGFIGLAILPDLAKTGVVLPKRGWAVATGQRVGALPLAPMQPFRHAGKVTIAVGDDVQVQRDGETVAVFPRHAADFLLMLAATPVVAPQAAVGWLPGYAPEDVGAIFAILAKLGVIEPAG